MGTEALYGYIIVRGQTAAGASRYGLLLGVLRSSYHGAGDGGLWGDMGMVRDLILGRRCTQH